MLVIDRLAAGSAAARRGAAQAGLTHVFRNGHVNARNRLQQTLRTGDRISRKTVPRRHRERRRQPEAIQGAAPVERRPLDRCA